MKEIIERIQTAACSRKTASDLTHAIYRYPASMSPVLAREIILSFTQKNDFVLDPFCGGGTTAIESVSNGRKIICSDINSLASTITKAKTTPLKETEINLLSEWSTMMAYKLKQYKRCVVPESFKIENNLHSRKTVWLLEKIKYEIETNCDDSIKDICKLILLSVGKNCYDCRDKSLNPARLINAFEKISVLAIKSITEYSNSCYRNSPRLNKEKDIKVFCSNAIELSDIIDKKISKKIKLVLTSPPYPGVHILYHRWQVKGRRQTSLPFNLLNLNDGSPLSYYTLGAETKIGYEFYFESIKNIFNNLQNLIPKDATLVQVISFKEPEWQLPRYLSSMRNAGYEEIYLNGNIGEIITREVPNRKWYTNLNDKKAIEYILFHRKK